MGKVLDAIEKAVLSQLTVETVETCASILSTSRESGLETLKCTSRALALSEFDAFASSADFLELGEDLLGSLLDDDALRSESEERVLEMVVQWMMLGGAAGAVRGAGLVRKIRFHSWQQHTLRMTPKTWIYLDWMLVPQKHWH